MFIVVTKLEGNKVASYFNFSVEADAQQNLDSLKKRLPDAFMCPLEGGSFNDLTYDPERGIVFDAYDFIGAAKASAQKAILDFAGMVGAKIKKGVPQIEIDGWTKKAAEALIVGRGDAPSPDTTPLLWAEADGNIEAIQGLAQRVLAKAKVFASISGLTSRMRATTEAAIDAAENAEAVAAIIEAAEADAKTKLSDLGIEFNSPTTHPTQGG